MHSGSSAPRHSGFIQTLVQILRGHEFGWSPETLLQRSPPAAHRQRPGKGPQEDQDAAVWVGGFHIRPKEWHGCNDGRRGDVGEGGRGGEAPAAASSPHPQACFHAPRKAFARAAVHLPARQGTAAHDCRNCYWWVLYIWFNHLRATFVPYWKKKFSYILHILKNGSFFMLQFAVWLYPDWTAPVCVVWEVSCVRVEVQNETPLFLPKRFLKAVYLHLAF